LVAFLFFVDEDEDEEGGCFFKAFLIALSEMTMELPELESDSLSSFKCAAAAAAAAAAAEAAAADDEEDTPFFCVCLVPFLDEDSESPLSSSLKID